MEDGVWSQEQDCHVQPYPDSPTRGLHFYEQGHARVHLRTGLWAAELHPARGPERTSRCPLAASM